MTLARRSFLTGLAGTVICAPAIVRASSLMAIKPGPIEFISPVLVWERPVTHYRLDIELPMTVPALLQASWRPFYPRQDASLPHDIIIPASLIGDLGVFGQDGAFRVP